jgi:general nucleoside transport system ATP-binding protein
LGLADRVAVMHRGKLTPLRPRADWTLAALGLAMAGSGAEGAAIGHGPAPVLGAGAPPGAAVLSAEGPH